MLAELQRKFLALLPRIQRHAGVVFRDIRCPDRKEELTAEAIALSWRWFLHLAERGKDVSTFPSAFATFACRAARSGRRLCGQEKAKGVLSTRAQRHLHFHVGKLPDSSTLSSNPLSDALIDNTMTPPDEQVCFRLDFPAWLVSLGERKRQVAEDLMMGERTSTVAHKHGCSQARISQMRWEMQQSWNVFGGYLAGEAS
jgi:hypothetical protein